MAPECNHHHMVRTSDEVCLCVQCGEQKENGWTRAIAAPYNWRSMDADDLILWYVRTKLRAKI
jgi:hypothetical protein